MRLAGRSGRRLVGESVHLRADLGRMATIWAHPRQSPGGSRAHPLLYRRVVVLIEGAAPGIPRLLPLGDYPQARRSYRIRATHESSAVRVDAPGAGQASRLYGAALAALGLSPPNRSRRRTATMTRPDDGRSAQMRR